MSEKAMTKQNNAVAQDRCGDTVLRSYQGAMPSVADSCYIDPSAVVIGKVDLAEDVSLWPLVVLRGDVNRISVGARSNIQDGSVIHVSRPSASQPEGYPTLIGEDVTVGHKVMLHGCIIRDRVLVGIGAIILDGAVIDSDVIVAAGALVTPGKHLASGFVYTGSPATAARPLRDNELAKLKTGASNYVLLKNQYLQEPV